nr:MBOAT family protein [Hanstruepera ponticola]
MLFNSFEYLIFLPIVFLLYWFAFNRKLNWQNLFLLIISYIFYGWWDWRFLTLIAFSSLVDYNVGLQIDKTKTINKRKLLLAFSLIVNIGLLGYFKYSNFFIENFKLAFESIGITMHLSSLQIILPVGISFYTFQTMGYTIDVYRRKINPTNNIVQFFAYVSFFPQLVAGPIERAKNLLPQFQVKRKFRYDYAVDGMRQILWGFFKKMVIADNCALFVNQVFDAPEDFSFITLIFGMLLFAFQIYGDFSGYSDIAIGTAKLFGFNLMQNFAYPYFSRDIAEFWRRWHISLSTWFRDYVYIPLGGSKGGTVMKIRNVFVIFLVSGFWHGANWTFIIWGFLNALFFLPLILMNKNRTYLDIVAVNSSLPSLREFLGIISTFVLTTFAWVFFRAETLGDSMNYLYQIVNGNEGILRYPIVILCLSVILILVEWIGRKRAHPLAILEGYPVLFRQLVYLSILLLIILFMPNEANSFIYFQF